MSWQRSKLDSSISRRASWASSISKLSASRPKQASNPRPTAPPPTVRNPEGVRRIKDDVTLGTGAEQPLQKLSEAVALLKEIGKKSHQNTEDREKVDRLTAEISRLNTQLSTRTQERRGR